jgi:hypothetical protein
LPRAPDSIALAAGAVVQPLDCMLLAADTELHGVARGRRFMDVGLRGERGRRSADPGLYGRGRRFVGGRRSRKLLDSGVSGKRRGASGVSCGIGVGVLLQNDRGGGGGWRVVLCKTTPPLLVPIRSRSGGSDWSFHSFHRWASFYLIRSLIKWLGTGFTLLVLTPVLSHLFAHVLVFEFQVGDLKNIWLIYSGCSRHMTGDKGWFSSLVQVVTNRCITFGDNGRGRVLSEGDIKVYDKITLRRVALVQSLGYNLLSVSQLLDEGFQVFFRPGGSRTLDSQGDLVCMVVPEGQVFRADFSQSSGVERCFSVGSSSELWKWHMKLGHLSFDLLSHLSKLNLVRGLPWLRFEKELVCALFRHAKMVASSHSPLTDVMTERPYELLHMDLVGPARV